MKNYNEKLIDQLKNISRNAGNEKDYRKSTQKAWERKINKAFEYLGLEQFKYLDKKTPEAKRAAISKAAATLSKRVETVERIEKRELEKSQKKLMKKAIKNIKDLDINERTANKMAERGLMPEKADINNMTKEEIEKNTKLMEVAPELRALTMAQDYTSEFLETYFSKLIEDKEVGVAERVEKLAYAIAKSGDLVKVYDFIEYASSNSFKGGYDDTDKMVSKNSDLNKSNIMFDRLSRLENEYMES